MEATKTKIPAEAVDLYTRYIHGEVSRRDFFGGVSRFAVGGVGTVVLLRPRQGYVSSPQSLSETG